MTLPRNRRIFDMGRTLARVTRESIFRWVRNPEVWDQPAPLTPGPGTVFYGQSLEPYLVRRSRIMDPEEFPPNPTLLGYLMARMGIVDREEILRRVSAALDRMSQVQRENVVFQPDHVVLGPDVTEILVDLAKRGQEEDFRFLARSHGVPASELDELWRGTMLRLGLSPGTKENGMEWAEWARRAGEGDPRVGGEWSPPVEHRP